MIAIIFVLVQLEWLKFAVDVEDVSFLLLFFALKCYFFAEAKSLVQHHF